MKAMNVMALWAVPVALAVLAGCGKIKNSGDQGSGAVDASQRLGNDPCGRPLLNGPQGQEPVPVFPLPGQPGYQPVPPTPGPGGAPPNQIPPGQVAPGPPRPNGPGIPDCNFPVQKPGGPVVVPGKPGGNPGQMPGQTPCHSDCQPPPCHSGCQPPYAPSGKRPEPMPLPSGPAQIPQSECGKPGTVCFPGAGGPAQFPGQAQGGASYDQRDVQACLGGMAGKGLAPQGAWGLQVTELKAVSVLGNNTFVDSSVGPRIVMLKATSILGSTQIILANPQALYCIKSLSILDQLHIGSCWANNVVVLRDVSILSNTSISPLQCP